MLCMPRAARTSPQPSSSATPLSEQHSSAGLDAAAQRRKKGRKCLFRRFPGKPGRPGGKRLLGRRTSISGPATTERGSLRAHLAELVAGPSIAALYPPRVVCHVLSMPRPRERQAAGWLLHCPLQSSQQLVVHGRRRGVSLILSSLKSILTDHEPDTTHLTDDGHRLSRLGLVDRGGEGADHRSEAKSCFSLVSRSLWRYL